MSASAFDGSSANASCSAVLAARRLLSRRARLARRVSRRLCSAPPSAVRSTVSNSVAKLVPLVLVREPAERLVEERKRQLGRGRALQQLHGSRDVAALEVQHHARAPVLDRVFAEPQRGLEARERHGPVVRRERYLRAIQPESRIVGLVPQQLLDERSRFGVLMGFRQRVQQSALRGSLVGLEHERALEGVRCRPVAARFLLEVAERRVNGRAVAAELDGTHQVRARVLVALGPQVEHPERLVRTHMVGHPPSASWNAVSAGKYRCSAK